MKYLLISDKFKGSLSSKEVNASIARGISVVDPEAEIESIIASDGGDGFLDSVQQSRECNRIELVSVNALGGKISSYYLFDKKDRSAYIELANTCGFNQLNAQRLDIMRSNTRGVGIQLKDAISKKAKRVYIGLGGSVTNDAGLGIAYELGYRFFDVIGNHIQPRGDSLNRIANITRPENDYFCGTDIFVVNDVDNPLYGSKGASFVFAQQKGASKSQIVKLDNGLQHLEQIVQKELSKDCALEKGSGAAGGTSYGLKVFFDAQFINGFEFLNSRNDLISKIMDRNYDYVITGEGSFDEQSFGGKLIQGVIKLVRKNPNSKLLIVCGIYKLNRSTPIPGISNIIELKNNQISLEYCINNASYLIEKRINNYFLSLK